MDEVHRKKMGCAYLGMMWRGEKFVIISKKPITSADFSGWKMHSIPIYTTGLKYLGASTVALTTPEFYGALEKGVVDAIPQPMGGVPLDMKLYEVSKYILHRQFYYDLCNLFGKQDVGMDSFRCEKNDYGHDYCHGTRDLRVLYKRLCIRQRQTRRKGMKITELPPAEVKKFNYAFSDYTWEKSCEAARIRKIYEICKPHLTR
jgi:hypothetical protein